MPNEPVAESLDHLMFRHLITEFEGDSLSEAERAIKREMKAKDLGKLDSLALERVRNLKRVLQKEIGLFAKSKYYVKTLESEATQENFDQEQMVNDLIQHFPEISLSDMRGIVALSVFAYYLR